MLPVASLPQVEYPVISVGAGFPGADPETVASAIVTPLERQFARIAGVNEMTSSSGLGNGSIVLQFDLSRNIDGAARDVQAAINAARSQLPSNLPQNPSYRKINPSDSPILILALTSDTLSVPQLYDACDSILAQKIAQVEGVGQTFCGGRCQACGADRSESNAVDELRPRVSRRCAQPSARSTSTSPRDICKTEHGDGASAQPISSSGAAACAPLIVATDRGPVSSAAASNGLPASVQSAIASGSTSNTSASTTAATRRVRLLRQGGHGIVRVQDVAQVIDSVEDVHTGGFFNGKPAILVIVFKTSTANVIDTVDNVMKLLPSLQAAIPPAVQLHVALDRTTTIRASIKDVTRTLIISVRAGHPCCLRLPARGSVDADPEASPSPAESSGNLRHHVSAGLHAGQPQPDGPDDFDRIRGR